MIAAHVPAASPGLSSCVALTPLLPPGFLQSPALKMHRVLFASLWLLAASPTSSIFQKPTGSPGREQGWEQDTAAWGRCREVWAGAGLSILEAAAARK